jgi:hypothetical protein
MFVFEDFVLFERPALAYVVGQIGTELFARGFTACESKLAFGPEMARAAQQDAISIVYRLDQEGRLEVLRGEKAGPWG